MKVRITLGILLGLVGLYGLMGILQAGMLFTGARALSNFNFWASVSFLAYAASVVVLTRAWRLIPRLPTSGLGLAAILLCAAGLFLVLPVIAEFFAKDACLASGGSFNYVDSTCDHSTTHPYIGLGWRSGFRLVFSFTCFTGGAALAWLLVRRVRANNSLKPKPLRGSA